MTSVEIGVDGVVAGLLSASARAMRVLLGGGGGDAGRPGPGAGDRRRPGQHVIVLIHGLHGAAGDLAYMAGVLRQRCVDDDDGVRVLLPTCNEGRTHDGIEAGAARLLQWLLPELASARYLSVIGHSLGGLYARCLIGMLADRHVIPDRVTPVAYVTFATPHLGSRQHRHLLGTWAPSWASASLFGTTGRQLMLDDDDAGPPLLVRLARPPFITGLALFQKRVAYGNVHGDGIVHYATSTVRRYNPFDGAAPAAPWVVVEDKHDNGDRRPRNAHVNEMVGNLERLDWQRLAVRPGRSLFAHVDIVVVLEAFSAPYGRPIVGDVAERVIGALHDQLLLHPAPSSSLLVRMVDDVLFGSDDADRPAR